MTEMRANTPRTVNETVLILTTNDLAGLIDPIECINAIESALREPNAMSRQTLPRRRLYVPCSDIDAAQYYFHNNMAGVVLAANTLAVRLDVSRVRLSRQRQEFPGDFSGIVLLYDLERAAPYAIIHDHGLSPTRVAATSAIASRELATRNARVLGLIGTGEQAIAHALAHVAVMPSLETVLYYSRSQMNRDRATRRTRDATGVAAASVSDVDELIQRSDVVVAATNSAEPVFDGRSLRPGQHVVTIASSDGFLQRREIDDASFSVADIIVVNSKEQIIADGQRHFAGPAAASRLSEVLELTDLLSGRTVGRSNDAQITLYDNNVGLGIQFAAVGALAYEKARKMGLGVEVPAALFITQKMPDELYAP